MTPNSCYVSFMLRLQWTQNDDRPTWVVSMQSTKTGEQRWFPSLDALVQFLQDEFGGYEVTQDSNPQAARDGETALPEKDRRVPKNRKTDTTAGV